ncbi:MAG TPA: putative Ig domain-containing protein [Candidatus Acidoferrales bacterium]|nr:putative Ig domain-containing protein [Candidatus Acidoferrales bacterium]
MMDCPSQQNDVLDARQRKKMKKRSLWLALCGLMAGSLLAGCGGGSAFYSIAVSPNAPQSVDQGQSIPFTAFVPGDQTNSGVTWSLSGPHCSAAACGTLSNVTTTSMTYVAPKSTGKLLTVVLTITANVNNSATTTINITVNPAPIIATVSLPGVLNGATYSQQIIANGGVSPLIFTISSGSLPPGLHLNTNGFLTGRPTVDGGNYTFTVTVTDQGTPPLTASQTYTITVGAAPPFSIGTTSMPNAAQGSPYNFPFAAVGGVPPVTWSIIAGSLPPGLSLAPTTGQVSGTPTTQGSFGFTLQATDSSLLPPNGTAQVAQQPLTLTVGAPNSLSITTTTLSSANTAIDYSVPIHVTGGISPFTWVVTSGILPSGLSLDPSSGVISGVPTAVSTNTFTVQVTDSESPAQQASQTLTLAVAASPTNDALLSGNYVFTFNGFDGAASDAPIMIGGTLTFDGGGHVVQGFEDINIDVGITQNDNTPGPSQDNAISFGTYTVGSDGRGSFTLNVAGVSSTYRFVLNAAGDAQFVESDNSQMYGTGILRKQDNLIFSPSNFSGNYVFELAGPDSSGNRYVETGVLSADGVSLLQNGNADVNDGGTANSYLTGVTGTFLVGQNGRGTASITTPNGTLNFVFYMVSPSDVLFAGMDALAPSTPTTTGEAILQTQPSFDATSLNGSMVVTEMGQTSAGKSSVLGGLLSASGGTSVSLASDSNSAGTVALNSNSTGSYSVAPNGRAMLTGIGSQVAVLYLISPNEGFVIGQDAQASGGVVESQSAGPFNSASATSYFSFGPPLIGTPAVTDKSGLDFTGSLLSDGVSSMIGKFDEGGDILNPGGNIGFTGSYSIASNGRGILNLTSTTGVPTQFVLYILSPSDIRAIPSAATDLHPQVFFLRH